MYLQANQELQVIKNLSFLTPVKINLEFSSRNISDLASLANLLINRFNDPIRN